MFGFVKKMLRKLVETPAQSQELATTEAEAATSFEANDTADGQVEPQHGVRVRQNGKGLELPLQGILNGLPLELRAKVKYSEVGDLTISVPLEKILSQLARGSVKISFGELRQAVPQVFTSGNDRDRVLVALPLGEIIARLNPALIIRRRVQKQVEVPADINSPFDPNGAAMIFSVGPAKPEPPPAAAPRHTSLRLAAPLSPARSELSSAPTPPPPEAIPAEAPEAVAAPRAVAERNGRPSTAAQPSVPQPQKTANGSNPLIVGLTTLAEAWPDAVREEIVRLNLVDAKVALPAELVERALKQGRILFTWKTLRSWIKPSPLPAVSAHDGAVLELPLRVVAPLFLARQREANKSQQPVPIDENIPNLFFGFPQLEQGSATVASIGDSALVKPKDTNYYVWDDCADTVRVDESELKRGPSGTNFIARYATPNEIVSRASALDGVAGALIALPDGLMVASRLAADLNGDTLAAFLPQIFGKVSQCTKELRMGELNNLNFTVGNVPWKIFRVHAIFFAAFGQPGEPLPTSGLAALAAELDRKPK